MCNVYWLDPGLCARRRRCTDVGDAEAPLELYLWHIQWDVLRLETTITDDAKIHRCGPVGRRKIRQSVWELRRMGVKSRVADFWRYAKIYLDGGVYADIDVTPSEGFAKTLPTGHPWLSSKKRCGSGYWARRPSFRSRRHSKVPAIFLRFWQQRLGIPSFAMPSICAWRIFKTRRFQSTRSR